MLRLAGSLILIALAWAAVVPASASADDAAADSTLAIGSGIPELQGHRFIPAPLVPTPFIHTFLQNTLGVATAKDIETPPIIIGGNEVPGLKGDLSAAVLTFEYQLAIKRWLAVRAQVSMGGRFGTGVQTLLAEGVATSIDFDFGWVFNLHRGKRTRLSGALNISNRTVTSVSVFNLVSDIVDGTNLGLSHKTPVLSGDAGLRFAWALNPLLGLTANATVGNGDTLDRTLDSTWFYRAGLALSFDLDEYGVPMGAVLSGARLDNGNNDVVDASAGWEAGVRVSYIGRESFLISLDLSWAEIPTTGLLESFSANWMGVSLRYFF